MISVDCTVYCDALDLLMSDKADLRDLVKDQMTQSDYELDSICNELPEEYEEAFQEADLDTIMKYISINEDDIIFDYGESEACENLRTVAFRIPCEFDEEKWMKSMCRSEINGITLLSVEEYDRYNENIATTSQSWWLRSPGFNAFNAAFVYDGAGDVCNYGNFVIYKLGVRPALCISALESSELKIGDSFRWGEQDWTVISDHLALCDEIIDTCAFRRDWKAENANDYEASDIKGFVEDWFEKAKEAELNKTEHEDPGEERE